MSEVPHEYASGAKRSEKLPLMRLIPHSTLKHLALALTEGNRKYEMIDGRHCPTTCNWRNGDLQFQLDCADHLMNHVATFCTQLHKFGLAPDEVEKARQEMLLELGHALANIAFLIEFIEKDEDGLLDLMVIEDETVGGIKRAKRARQEIADKTIERVKAATPVLKGIAESRSESDDSWKATEVTDNPVAGYPRYFQRQPQSKADVWLYGHTSETERQWFRTKTGEEGLEILGASIELLDQEYTEEVFPAWAAK